MTTEPLTYSTVVVDGFTWRMIDQGDGPVVLLCHGFPGLAFSWRHQVHALSANGFRAIALDMPGYGGTDRPVEIAEYSFAAVAGRIVALLDELGIDDVLAVGHDFGSPAAWTLARRHRDRVRGLMLMAMPYAPDRLPVPPTQAYAHVAQKHFFHFDYFQEPGVADAELDSAPGEFLARVFHALSGDAPYLQTWDHPSVHDGVRVGYLDALPTAPPLPWPWLSSDEFAVYETTFAATGFTGGLNWYRAADVNWSEMADDDPVLDVPAYFLNGENDPALAIAGEKTMGRMRETMPCLRAVHTYDGAGHFIMAECAREVSAALIGFARTLR
ncbi:alpha/beta fold hydrolase [Williamsia phyllosphaerae]|uniref:Epoxide hydrolase EphA n=1 Tax=Williamsia phyllosphaerae TaxID=885042 RepID=A0ABQ1UFE6_9NOCA|nr:alpha/beta hydrolase [Williamsia phyllosphaerae]GGF15457.1 putative epoxide hydrolase EphA [Williamsia phyllosphaerae]